MNRIRLDSRPRRMEDVAAQSMPPDTILLHLGTGYYYSTNPIGAAVWERCDGERTIAEILEGIRSEFEAPADVEADVLDFLQHLLEEKMIAVHA